ncbi:hypothetical protein AAVH_19948 [Aphelenchoides avenae]|nr:hypothetical protein AAVH_19948 [Aphelenchus avenae]
MPTSPGVCELAETYATDSLLKVALSLELATSVVTICLVIALATRKQYSRVALHRNLKIRYFAYTDPCSLLVPHLDTAITRGLRQFYFIAFPLWHLVFSLERVWATTRPAEYEKSGVIFSVVSSVVVWSCSAAYVAYMLYLAYQDETFRTEAAYPKLDVQTAVGVVIISNYTYGAVDAATLIMDLVLAVVNQRRVNRIAPGYSLGRSYQLKENVAVTQRLILPLAFCNTMLFVCSNAVAIVVRTHRAELEPHTSLALLEAITVVILLQPPLSMLLYMRYCRRQKPMSATSEPHKETDLHFELFSKQLDAAYWRSLESS